MPSRLDDLIGILVEPFDVDLDIKVAGIREDGAVFQFLEVPGGNDCKVTGCGHENITDGCCFVHGHDHEPVHMGLKGSPWVDLGYNDFCAEPVGFLRKPPPAETVTGDYEVFPGDQGVCRDHNRREGTLPRSVDIVKEPLHGGVVHGDDRELQFALRRHRAEAVDTCRGLFAATNNLLDEVTALRVDIMDKIHPVIDGNYRLASRTWSIAA